MRYVRQETRKSCGVACVAMVAGVTFSEAGEAIGKVGCTRTQDLRRGLACLGLSIPPRLKPMQPTEMPDGIVKVRNPTSVGRWHWVVKRRGRIYDPQLGVFALGKYVGADLMSSILPVAEWSDR